MRRIMMIAGLALGMSFPAWAQEQKTPIYIDNGPSVFEYSYNPYYSYSDQGNALYHNNSQWYNKDNYMEDVFSPGNGQYVKPGNSNRVNNEMYNGNAAPPTIIYSGYIPVREAGANPSGGRESNYEE